MSLNLKDKSVILDGLHYKMLPVLVVAEAACHDFGVEFVITSGRDAHDTGKHPTGEAIDVRTRDLKTDQQKRNFARRIARELGREFDVILHEPPEIPHLHIEFDPK